MHDHQRNYPVALPSHQNNMLIGKSIFLVERKHNKKPAQFFLEDEITFHYVSF
jgi:hypothetical protein